MGISRGLALISKIWSLRQKGFPVYALTEGGGVEASVSEGV